MFDEDTPPKASAIPIGGDVSTLSLEDLDERMAMLAAEIERLKAIRQSKAGQLSAAEAFFKKPMK